MHVYLEVNNPASAYGRTRKVQVFYFSKHKVNPPSTVCRNP